MLTFHLWNERLIPSSKEVLALEEIFALITDRKFFIFLYFPCYGTIGLPSPLVFYAVVEIVMRFSDTDLSLLICLCVIEVKSEGSRYRE